MRAQNGMQPTQSPTPVVRITGDGAGVGHDIVQPAVDAAPVRGHWIVPERRGPGRAVVHGTRRAARQVIRAAGPQAGRGSGYRELEFVLADSASARRSTRRFRLRPPKRSALHRCCSEPSGRRPGSGSTGPCSGRPRFDGIEAGRSSRIDSTVTETHILEPSDSQLLYDAVRVLSRPLARGRRRSWDPMPSAFTTTAGRRSGRSGRSRKARMKRKVVAVPRVAGRLCGGASGHRRALAHRIEGREEPWLDDSRTQVAHVPGPRRDGRPP